MCQSQHFKKLSSLTRREGADLFEREKDGFININNKTKQANGPKQSLFGLITPIHIQIKTTKKKKKIKKKRKEKEKKRRRRKNSITLQSNRYGITLQY